MKFSVGANRKTHTTMVVVYIEIFSTFQRKWTYFFFSTCCGWRHRGTSQHTNKHTRQVVVRDRDTIVQRDNFLLIKCQWNLRNPRIFGIHAVIVRRWRLQCIFEQRNTIESLVGMEKKFCVWLFQRFDFYGWFNFKNSFAIKTSLFISTGVMLTHTLYTHNGEVAKRCVCVFFILFQVLCI